MLGKSDVIDSLSRDLARARDKRDALTSGVTTLTAQIAELEARLSAEADRRERERLASEIEAINKQLKDSAGRFIPMITELRDATAAAAVIAPGAHELHGLLLAVAAEVDAAIVHLLCELDQRVQEVCSSHATPHLPPPSLDLPSRRKIMLSYFVFQSGCRAKSRRQKMYQLKISAV